MEKEIECVKNFLINNTCGKCTGWPHCQRSKNKYDTCENFKNAHEQYLKQLKEETDGKFNC